MQAIRFASAAAVAMMAGLFTQGAWASCYVVYGPDKDIVYRASEPPVDLSRQIHETLPLVAPNSVLVFSPDNHGCDLPINKLPLASASASAQGMRPARADRG